MPTGQFYDSLDTRWRRRGIMGAGGWIKIHLTAGPISKIMKIWLLWWWAQVDRLGGICGIMCGCVSKTHFDRKMATRRGSARLPDVVGQIGMIPIRI